MDVTVDISHYRYSLCVERSDIYTYININLLRALIVGTHEGHSRRKLTKGTHEGNSRRELTKGAHEGHSRRALSLGGLIAQLIVIEDIINCMIIMSIKPQVSSTLTVSTCKKTGL